MNPSDVNILDLNTWIVYITVRFYELTQFRHVAGVGWPARNRHTAACMSIFSHLRTTTRA